MILSFLSFFFCFLFSSVHSASTNSSTNTSENVSKCLKEFYSIAYNGNDYNCTKSLNLFSNNSTSTFKTAKSCFLEVAEEECPQSQFRFLSTKYDQFLEDLNANDTNCSSLNNVYSAQKCQPLITDISVKIALVPDKNVKINDPTVLELIDLCNKTKKCLAENCYWKDDEKTTMREYCEIIELTNTEFTVCQQRIIKEAPDLSEFKCLYGFDFYLQTISFVVDKYTLKRDCTKEIMEDICGKEAVKDFEKNADIYLKNLRRLEKLADGIEETADSDE
uniref:DUF19 domain-containing protein n=1 Tax=Caenorhabditis tropicalis TaxID=1561998 RepID=A0A1I7TYL1_9PELO